MAARRWLLLPLAAGLLAACGSGPSSSRPSATALLHDARSAVNHASAVRFSLSSSGVSGSGVNLVGGSGDIVRPASLRGSFAVSTAGVQVSVKVLSIGSRFWAVLPFSSTYTRTSPAKFGLKNPATLLSPTSGVSALLTAVEAPEYRPSIRLDGELLDVVSGTIPGNKVPVLPDANPSKPVRLSVDIDPSSHQVRRVLLAGPFTSAKSTATYTVTLTDYGEHVTISPPS